MNLTVRRQVQKKNHLNTGMGRLHFTNTPGTMNLSANADPRCNAGCQRRYGRLPVGATIGDHFASKVQAPLPAGASWSMRHCSGTLSGRQRSNFVPWRKRAEAIPLGFVLPLFSDRNFIGEQHVHRREWRFDYPSFDVNQLVTSLKRRKSGLLLSFPLLRGSRPRFHVRHEREHYRFRSCFTSANFSIANARSVWVCAAEIWVRMRALPCGTTG
jgi:hypothetical protein